MREGAPAGEVEIGPARAEDAAAIVAMVRAERLNPTGLDWRNFLVARHAGALVGAAQLRPHRPGVRELGSLVVRADCRGRGIGARLVEARIARAGGARLYAIVVADAAARYAAWGFRPLPPWHAPWQVALGYAVGQAATLLAPLQGRRPRWLVVLERPPGR